jgi:folate-binding protein YgfZ
LEALGAADFHAGDRMAYETLRLMFGIPEGTVDLVQEKSLPMESNLDLLNGIDWNKGCYVGQELTARMHYRGLAKKRMLPVAIAGEVPAMGTPVTYDGQEAGEMRSGMGEQGIALLRLETVAAAKAAGRPLLAGGAEITPQQPPWLPAEAAEASATESAPSEQAG